MRIYSWHPDHLHDLKKELEDGGTSRMTTKTKVWLGGLVWLLIFLDGWNTTYLVQQGMATELNPVANYLIQINALIYAKAILAGLVTTVMYKYGRLWPYLLLIAIHLPLVAYEFGGMYAG